MPPAMSSLVREPRKESRSASRFAGRRVHFTGIGGCGMSGLAHILLDAGAVVTGSEPKPNQQTFDLTSRGVRISRDQLGELLTAQTDLVVRTAAVGSGTRIGGIPHANSSAVVIAPALVSARSAAA